MRRFRIISALLVFIFVVQIYHVALAHIMDGGNAMMPCGGAGIPPGIPSDGCVCCVLQQADKNSNASGVYRIPFPLPIFPVLRPEVFRVSQNVAYRNAVGENIFALEKKSRLQTIVQRK